MRTIKISEEVWQAIAEQGKFGETENDVLEKILKIQTSSNNFRNKVITARQRNKFADQRMSADILGKTLHITFQNGDSKKWTLPESTNKLEIRKIRDEAVNFAKQNGASFGQEQAVKKAFTNAGYWLTK